MGYKEQLSSTRLFMWIITIFISIHILQPDLQVHASEVTSSEVNGGQTDNDNQNSSRHLVGGATEAKQGIFMYFAEKDGGYPVTAGYRIVKSAEGETSFKDTTGIRIKHKFGDLRSQFVDTYTDLPVPVLIQGNASEFHTNGYEIKKWLKREKDGIPFFLQLANQGSFGNQIASSGKRSVYDELMQNPEKYVLVVMPICWMNVYENGLYTSRKFIGTADGWAYC